MEVECEDGSNAGEKMRRREEGGGIEFITIGSLKRIHIYYARAL
jgi:hypothetical protein